MYISTLQEGEVDVEGYQALTFRLAVQFFLPMLTAVACRLFGVHFVTVCFCSRLFFSVPVSVLVLVKVLLGGGGRVPRGPPILFQLAS